MYALGAVTADLVTVGDYLLGQAMVTAGQLTAHYVNEFADYKVDRLVTHRTLFSGGSGVLASGELSRPVALVAALLTSAAACVLIIFVEPISTTAALLGLISLAVSWLYSLRPVRLLDTGLGEVVTSIVVTVFVPVVGASVNGGSVTTSLGWAMAGLFPVHLAMMLVFELPDLETDKRAHKRVLAVRMGEGRAHNTITALLVAAAVLVGAGVATGGLDLAALWALVAAAVPAVVTVREMRGTRYGLLTSSAVATLVVLATGLLVIEIL
jgi:1,4-dihydroxy-2-naphthoate octaprenyltransferase